MLWSHALVGGGRLPSLYKASTWSIAFLWGGHCSQQSNAWPVWLGHQGVWGSSRCRSCPERQPCWLRDSADYLGLRWRFLALQHTKCCPWWMDCVQQQGDWYPLFQVRAVGSQTCKQFEGKSWYPNHRGCFCCQCFQVTAHEANDQWPVAPFCGSRFSPSYGQIWKPNCLCFTLICWPMTCPWERLFCTARRHIPTSSVQFCQWCIM